MLSLHCTYIHVQNCQEDGSMDDPQRVRFLHIQTLEDVLLNES